MKESRNSLSQDSSRFTSSPPSPEHQSLLEFENQYEDPKKETISKREINQEFRYSNLTLDGSDLYEDESNYESHAIDQKDLSGDNYEQRRSRDVMHFSDVHEDALKSNSPSLSATHRSECNPDLQFTPSLNEEETGYNYDNAPVTEIGGGDSEDIISRAFDLPTSSRDSTPPESPIPIHDEEGESDLDEWAPPAPKSHVVKEAYVPSRPDEIQLLPGDIIGIEKVYEDGWARGQNISQGRKRCMLPLSVLAHIVTGPTQHVRMDKGTLKLKPFKQSEEDLRIQASVSSSIEDDRTSSIISGTESKISNSSDPTLPKITPRIESLRRFARSKKSRMTFSSDEGEIDVGY